MMVMITPERSIRTEPLYEQISYQIKHEDVTVGSVIINRFQMRLDMEDLLEELQEQPLLHGALEAVSDGSWGDLSTVDYVVSVRVDPEHRGNGYGAHALSMIPVPSGSWQVLLPFPLQPAHGEVATQHEIDGLRRYWTRSGFRSPGEPGDTSFMVRHAG